MPNIEIPTPDGFFDQYLSSSEPEAVPEGYKTVDELSAQYSAPRTTIEARMHSLITKGLVARKKFRIQSNGKTVNVWHYGPPG